MLKIGIIGFGYWGNILYNSLIKNENVEVVKICGKKNDGIFTDNHLDVLKSDADLVIISTQAKYHYMLALEALEHDKNVLVEKPICLTVEEAERLIKYSNNNRLLFVDHIYDTNPAILKIAEIVKNDNLLSYESYRFNENKTVNDVNIIKNLMYHDFYIFKKIFNKDIDPSKIEVIKYDENFCELKIDSIVKFVASYEDVKTRLIKIKTINNEIFWDEINDQLNVNGVDVPINRNTDNINYKINDIINHIDKGVEDDSKYESLRILNVLTKNDL